MASEGKRSVRLKDYRNIGIMGHTDAGKTATMERVLYYTQDEYNQLKEEVEKDRGIMSTGLWDKHLINIVDMPDQVDFSLKLDHTIRALDGAICVFDSVDGVDRQSQKAWHKSNKYGVPRICFVNKMDRFGADFFGTQAMILSKLGRNPLVIQIPVGAGDGFQGVVDLVKMKAVIWSEQDLSYVDIPEDLQDSADAYRAMMIEELSDVDEVVMDCYDEGIEPDEESIKRAIRNGTVKCRFVPVMCGSAFENKGVQALLDAVVDYLPSPMDVSAIKGTDPKNREIQIERGVSDEEPFVGLAFKITTDPLAGSVTFVRVYAGKLSEGSYTLNSNKGKNEMIARILKMHKSNVDDLKVAFAGDIVAVTGLKYTVIGETLCDAEKPIVLERMDVHDPVIRVAIEPKTKADADKIEKGLIKLAQEDPSFHFSRDDESDQTVIQGMEELHLELIVDRLKKEFKVEACVGEAQVMYRESISRVYETRYVLEKQSGSVGFADITVRFEPMEAGSGYEFKSEIKGEAIPREYVSGVMKGLEECIKSRPVVDFRAVLLDGNYHHLDSTISAFQLAATRAFSEGITRAEPVMFEPVMTLEVVTPDEFFSAVVDDVDSRRGFIMNVTSMLGCCQVVKSMVPLASMTNYATDLINLAQGRAFYEMQFAKFEKVPQNMIQDKHASKKLKVAA